MRSLVMMMIFAAGASGQVAEEANRNYSTDEGRERMLAVLGAPERAERIQAEKLIAGLELKAGETVVDLGTGAGVLLPYLSQAVGSSGKVIAQDIAPVFVGAAKETVEKNGLKNVEYVSGSAKNPNVPAGAADLVVAVDAYHHFDYPEPMLAGIRSGLKPGGRFVIVDYYKSGFRDPNHIRAEKPEVIREVEAGGFKLLKDIEHVPETQYMLIFTSP